MKEKIMDAVGRYLDAFRKYTGFTGRATRRDYWSFVIVSMVVTFVIVLAETIVGIKDSFISTLYSLAIICPGIALCTRRLHDVNKSGWWQLASVVPLLNLFYLYLLWIKPGTPESNKFGAPAASAAAASQPLYGAYSVPVENEFSGYEMCPTPKAEAQPESEPEPEAAAELPKCAACGAVLEANAKFCSECGSPINK